MPKTNEVMQFTVTLRGSKEAKSELEGIINTAKKADEQRSKAEGVGGGKGESKGGGGGGGVRDIAIGNLIGNAISRSFSAFNKTVANAFDSNLTTTERQVGVAKAGVEAIPFVGEALSGILSSVTQVQTGTSQGTASRLNNAFGPAFQAFGAANPNLQGEELENALRKRFGDQINKARQFFLPQERAREVGSRIVAEGDQGLTPQDLKDVANQTKEQFQILKDSVGGLVESLAGAFAPDVVQKFNDAVDNFQRNTKDFGTIIDRYIDFFSNPGQQGFSVGDNGR